jgi:hypothetical protein
MYIRTQMGNIHSGDLVPSPQNEIYNWNIEMWETIIKTGEYLIDVLEEKDLILNKATGQLVEVTKYFLKDDYWKIPIQDSFNTIITHEQYMELAQEVK